MCIIGLDIHRAFAEAWHGRTAGSGSWAVSTCGATCWRRLPQSWRRATLW